MAFVIAHRHSGFVTSRGRSMLSAGRLLVNKLRARSNLTPQERANLYASRMPIAVVKTSLGGASVERGGRPPVTRSRRRTAPSIAQR
jgi:hypothetical protein